ncbi:MAG: GNAT family N-acetyltransferase [Anaerolineales bacterium]|nr:GNAT family N-acetyltransferase [Anaerolineales bacterium]
MKNRLIFRAAQKSDFKILAPWLVAMGQEAQRQCLHTWSGDSADELQQALTGYWEDGELCYMLALRNEQIVGAMGSEFDKALGRAWLHGPHAIPDEWEPIAEALFQHLLAELPAVIQQWDAYLNIENKQAQRFYIDQGFRELNSLNYDFWLTPDDRVGAGKHHCQMLAKEHAQSFITLYARLFPSAYYSGERILQMIGDSHQVMVIADGGDVLGFVVINTLGETLPGEIQFLGVQEDCRHRGYGRRLLLAGIDWLFDISKAPRIFLNVSQDLIYAQALYESVGFKLRYTGIGLRKKV